MLDYIRHHGKKKSIRIRRKAEEQLEPEDSGASKTKILPVWENTLQFHVASNASNSAIAHLLSVKNTGGSPEARRICRRWLEFNPSPDKTQS